LILLLRHRARGRVSLSLLFAFLVAFGGVNFPARASELPTGWRLEKKTDKLTGEISCRLFKDNAPAILEIFQMVGSKNILGAAINSYGTFHVTRFRIDGGPAQHAWPVGILFDYSNTYKPTMNDLLKIQSILVEYENPTDGKSDVIEFKVEHIREAIERLHEKDCQ
jgi:hypothetical protein